MFAFYIFIQISNYTRAKRLLFPIERLQIRLLVISNHHLYLCYSFVFKKALIPTPTLTFTLNISTTILLTDNRILLTLYENGFAGVHNFLLLIVFDLSIEVILVPVEIEGSNFRY
jgi:hypothetical protein